MRLNRLTPMIYTENLQESVDFYVQTLGFICVANESDWGWARVQRDNIELMISKPNDHIPFENPTFTGSFYFYADNVDEVWFTLKDRAKICYPLEKFDYGMREFAIYDNNGYILQFGQEISEMGYQEK